MRTRFLHSALLLAALPCVACQPSSYVLVQLDSVPAEARSLKILVQRGSQVSTPITPLALPNNSTAGLSFRLDLPPAADENQPVDVQVGAFSRAAGEGCLLATGGTRAEPREVASVHVTAIADLATCTEGDVVVKSVTPNLLPTDKLSSTELVLTGWGFQPDTQIQIDGAAATLTSFVSATEIRVTAPAAKRVGPQTVSAKNQGLAHTTAGLLTYYASQVTYTSMVPTDWKTLGIFKNVLRVNGSALIRTDQGLPRFSLLASENNSLPPWDLLGGFPYVGYSDQGTNDTISPKSISFYQNAFNSPTQILTAPFDFEPLDDIAVIDTGRLDFDVQNKVGFRAGIAKDVTFVFCSNFQTRSMPIVSITRQYVKDKGVADLIIGYDDGSYGILSGSPRGIFAGPATKKPNFCEIHQISSPNPISSVQSLHHLQPTFPSGNYLLVANQGAALYQLTGNLTGGPGFSGEPSFYHTPQLIADMTNSPISQVAVEDLDKDGLNEIIALYRIGKQPYIRIYHGLPPALVASYSVAQFNTPAADFPIAHDCAMASPFRLTDINLDGYADIIFGCRNSSGPSSIEAVLTSGSPLKFVEQAQTVFIQPPNIDGDRVFFERIDPGSAQPLELWGGIGAIPFRLINTSH